MDSNYFRIIELIDLHVKGKLTVSEREELAVWQQRYPHISKWLEKENGVEIEGRYEFYRSNAVELDWQKILGKKRRSSMRSQKRIRWGIVAAVFFSVLMGAWAIQNSDLWHNLRSSFYAEKVVISPGVEKAILTLSDGRTLILGEKGEQIFSDGEVAWNVQDNRLDYSALSTDEVYQHKLKIPIGGTYRIQLADGTLVWLNADSELEYPSSFPGNERFVKVIGEAFFDIAKDPSKPFKVEVNGATIEALGTSFNVNTHRYDGKTKTILTEGKIKVKDQSKEVVIEAGYATVSGSGTVDVQKADVEEALSWKEGYFYFNNKSLYEICGEISRWYNIELQMDKTVGSDKYIGGIKRTESIEAVCQVLADLTGYKIEMKNRVLTVK